MSFHVITHSFIMVSVADMRVHSRPVGGGVAGDGGRVGGVVGGGGSGVAHCSRHGTQPVRNPQSVTVFDAQLSEAGQQKSVQ